MKTAPVARAEGVRARAAFPGVVFGGDSLLNTPHSSAAAAEAGALLSQGASAGGERVGAFQRLPAFRAEPSHGYGLRKQFESCPLQPFLQSVLFLIFGGEGEERAAMPAERREMDLLQRDVEPEFAVAQVDDVHNAHLPQKVERPVDRRDADRGVHLARPVPDVLNRRGVAQILGDDPEERFTLCSEAKPPVLQLFQESLYCLIRARIVRHGVFPPWF